MLLIMYSFRINTYHVDLSWHIGILIHKRTVRIETKKVMVYVCMAQVTEGACQQGVEGVNTLQAAEPPCSVSNGPVKINLTTSVSGGLIYKTEHRIAKYMLVYKTAYHN